MTGISEKHVPPAQRVAIIDCGAGNLHSVRKAFAHQLPEGATLEVVTDAAALADATHIVLPGVGAFADCMNGLNALPGMRAALEEKVLRGGTPFLGICVGMQMLFQRGYEHGTHVGLGWLQGEVRVIAPTDTTLKIPHMGWNRLRRRHGNFSKTVTLESPLPHRGRGLGEGDYTQDAVRGNAPSPHAFANLSSGGGEELQRHPILTDINNGDFVYFVHSYAATHTQVDDVAATVDYGGEIVAMVARDNIVATQFHPEKSQRVGLQLIANFLDM